MGLFLLYQKHLGTLIVSDPNILQIKYDKFEKSSGIVLTLKMLPF